MERILPAEAVVDLYEEDLDGGQIPRKPHRPGFDDILRKTLAYYSYILPMPRKWRNRLKERFGDDYREIEKRAERPYFGNRRLIIRRLKEKRPLEAYEAFWGTWNPPASPPIRAVYRMCGGDEKPGRATMAAFTYSGFCLHALNPVNPYTIPSYVAAYELGGAEGVAIAAGAITALHALAGIPVAVCKWRRKRQ